MNKVDQTKLAKEIALEVIANQPPMRCPNGVNAKTASILMDFANMWHRGKITMMTAIIFLLVGGIGTAIWYGIKLMAQSNIVRIVIVLFLLSFMFMGCQTKNISDKSITYYKDGKIDRVEKNYFDKTHGFVNWSDGNNKKMPFSDVTISGLSVGK